MLCKIKKKKKIPRLELLGNLLLSRLISSVDNNLTSAYSIDKIFNSTDSSIAYAWVHNINKVCKLFIQTQVQLIRELSFINCWRLVSSHLNPADIVSRGFLLNNVNKNKVCFKGFTFLTSPYGWPHFTIGDKFYLILVKKNNNVILIRFITKAVTAAYKALLFTLF